MLTHRSVRRPAAAGRTRARRGLASASLLAASALAIAAVPSVSGASGNGAADARAGTADDVRHVSVRPSDAVVLRAPEPAASTTQPTSATVGAPADAGDDLGYLGADGERIDVDRIQGWLEHRGSPLAPYAEDLVAAGVAYDVDPRVVLGIAGIESTVGEQIPEGSHNAWGWNGDGPRGLKAWDSWPEAIDDYTERLGRLYDTDNVDEDFAQTYCPPNWEKWLDTVQWVIGDI